MQTAGGRCNPCVTTESAVSASPVQTSRKHTRETGTFVCPIDGEPLGDSTSNRVPVVWSRQPVGPSYRSGACQNSPNTPSAPGTRLQLRQHVRYLSLTVKLIIAACACAPS